MRCQICAGSSFARSPRGWTRWRQRVMACAALSCEQSMIHISPPAVLSTICPYSMMGSWRLFLNRRSGPP